MDIGLMYCKININFILNKKYLQDLQKNFYFWNNIIEIQLRIIFSVQRLSETNS